ncbi:MAG: hypothetical protein ACOYJB_05865 [Christensenellaceae bacterium]|jgi:hypothetical protein
MKKNRIAAGALAICTVGFIVSAMAIAIDPAADRAVAVALFLVGMIVCAAMHPAYAEENSASIKMPESVNTAAKKPPCIFHVFREGGVWPVVVLDHTTRKSGRRENACRSSRKRKNSHEECCGLRYQR